MTFFPQPMPLAALGDFLELLLPIIFMILYVVGQLLANKKQGQQGRGKRPLRPVAPPRPRGVAGPQDANQPVDLEGALRKEVDEFLRRARGGEARQQPPRRAERMRKPMPRRGNQVAAGRKTTDLQPESVRSAHAGRQPPVPRQVATQRLSPPPRPIGWSSSSTPPGGLPASAARTAQTADSLRSQSVNAHVESHIDRGSRAIGQHADRLAESLEQTDERVQQRIENKFEHQVGKLQRRDDTASVHETSLAEEMADLLRSPEGIRQLIIAREIFDRPYS